MYETARAISFDHTLEIPDDSLPQVVTDKDGHFFSKYDPGLPLIAAPIVSYADRVAQKAIANRYLVAAIFVMIVPTTAMALASTGIFLIACYFYDTRQAILISFVAGFGTTVFPYARLFFAETIMTAILTLGIFILHSKKPSYSKVLIASIFIGIGIITRASTVIYVPSFAYLIWQQSNPPQRQKYLLIFLIGPAIAGVGLLWHNIIRFNDPFITGYEGETFSTFPFIGAMGMLISPGKSIFLYAPPLILSAILFPRFRQKHTILANTLLIMTATCLLYYGSWWAWHGGWVWGPRFLIPLMPLWCLTWGELPKKFNWHILATLIFFVGLGVQVVGTFTNVTPIYAKAFEGTDDPDDESRYAMVHYDLSFSPLIAGFKRATKNQWEKQVIYELQATDLTENWVYGVPQNIHRLFTFSVIIIGWAIWRNPRQDVEESISNGK